MASLEGEVHSAEVVKCKVVDFARNLTRDSWVIGGSIVVEKCLLLFAMC
jgi:hypothetical protein